MNLPRRPRPGIRTALIRRGGRSVLVTYPGLRLGNYLYFALHAWRTVREGRDYRVLDTGLGNTWYSHFPGLRDVMVDRIRPFDRREVIPPLFYQHYGADFDDRDLHEFVSTVLAIKPMHPFEAESITLTSAAATITTQTPVGRSLASTSWTILIRRSVMRPPTTQSRAFGLFRTTAIGRPER